MMKRIAIVVILVFVHFSLWAQDDSIEAEIMRFDGSRSTLIHKGRGLLIEKIVQGNRSKASAIFSYLLKQEGHGYLAFFPIEKQLLFYATFDFAGLLNEVLHHDSTLILDKYNNPIYPSEDQLLPKVLEYVRLNENSIRHEMAKSDFKSSDKAFLRLNLHYLIADYGPGNTVQDSLNASSNHFLQSHPGNEFESYIRKNIRYEVVPSKWAVGLEFFSGYSVFTDNLSKHFYNAVTVGIAVDVAYKNWTLFLRHYIGSSRIKDSISFSTATWQRHAKATMYMPEVSIGYVTYENRHVVVTPFMGISWAHLAPTDDDKENIPEYKDIGLSYTRTYTLGTNVDFKFGKPDAAFVSNGNSSYWFLRVRYSYNIGNFEQKYTGFNGNIHSLTIGLGGFSRALKRVY